MQVGDNIRFLNAVGGGKVVRIDNKQNLVYVEDEDGFEIPALINECVVVPAVNERTNFPLKDFSKKESAPMSESEKQIVQKPIKQEVQIVETADGDDLDVLLAFFPNDIKRMETTDYDCYLVNDSNYFLFYNIIIGEQDARRSIANGIIEPNMQEMISLIEKKQLNDWEHTRVQIVAFKKEKTYGEQPVIDTLIKLNPVRFYKLHSFTTSDYFEEPHLLINLVKEKNNDKLKNITAEEIKEAMTEKDTGRYRPRIEKQNKKKEIIEVDLHINSLLDSTAGMSNAEMLEYQMSIFHNTLNENKNKKGQRIVFIHGKGEGVLRKEIEKSLKHRYKNYSFQDASFKEYGFGATMVIIR